jgi:hypothetical protein
LPHILRHLGCQTGFTAVWLIAISIGMLILARYSTMPGQPASPPAEWPSGAPIQIASPRFTLAVFVHPQCPCSRATLGELQRIIACCRDRVETTVFFYQPPDTSDRWPHTDLWKSAAEIPTVRVLADRDAAAARRFGARTSGQTLLYDRDGRLVFKGGITAYRGHSGDNEGRAAIESFLLGGSSRRRSTPVFGCALFGVS